MQRRAANRICLAATIAPAAFACVLLLAGCGGNEAATTQPPPAASSVAPVTAVAPPAAPPADATGGFDGQRAYQFVADQVAIGPRTAGTDGDRRAQQYIISKLQSFGCPVDQEDFNASTPIGTVAMKNIVVQIPGASNDIILFGTHYDTKKLDRFVGADDGGSSTGVMLEMARLLCARKNAMTIWIAFLDGEEAFNFQWEDPDNTYGSRELAARMANSNDLPRVKAMLLADIVGSRDLRIKRELNSTGWLTDLVWNTAAKLGYGGIFVSQSTSIEDDHQSFLRRKVPAVDVIDLEIPYWHTLDDTLDKISPRSLAIVGHVLISTVPQLEQKFHPAAHS